MTTQTSGSFTWKTLLVRLVVVPLLVVLALAILVKVGDASELLRCWGTTSDGYCVVVPGVGL